MIALLGIGVVVLGFLFRLNPLLVIAAAVLVTGWSSGIDLVHIVAVFGHAFNDSRYISAVFVVLPVIGLLERAGLQERARVLIGGLRGATVGRLLLIYMVFRQLMSAIGLASAAGGQAQVVRPLLAPMAEAAAEKEAGGAISDKVRYLVRAHAAAADNIGVFFGEDIFLAIGSILLIKGFLEQNHIIVQPLSLSLWAIPTAIAAAIIHGTRILLLDRRLRQSPPPCGEVGERSDPGGGPLKIVGTVPHPKFGKQISTSPQGGGDKT
jgi:uncharacterized membrane protein